MSRGLGTQTVDLFCPWWKNLSKDEGVAETYAKEQKLIPSGLLVLVLYEICLPEQDFKLHDRGQRSPFRI